MEIGFCGLGRMGSAMARRLIDQGHRLTVWNRSERKATPLLEAGARWAKTPADAAAAGDIAITMLTDDGAVTAVYDGAQGLLSGPVKGKLFVEMSTVMPETTRALAGRVRAKGAALVECPVGGTVGPAREGKLIGMAGGEPQDFARARPILEQLCRRVDHLGPNGNGTAMKLAINLPLIVYWEALGEALALVRDCGIPAAKLLEIMGESSGGANALKARAAKLAAALEGGTADVGFDIANARKDLGVIAEVARRMGIELPVAATTSAAYDRAIAEGWGGQDASSLAAWCAAKAKKT